MNQLYHNIAMGDISGNAGISYFLELNKIIQNILRNGPSPTEYRIETSSDAFSVNPKVAGYTCHGGYYIDEAFAWDMNKILRNEKNQYNISKPKEFFAEFINRLKNKTTVLNDPGLYGLRFKVNAPSSDYVVITNRKTLGIFEELMKVNKIRLQEPLEEFRALACQNNHEMTKVDINLIKSQKSEMDGDILVFEKNGEEFEAPDIYEGRKQIYYFADDNFIPTYCMCNGKRNRIK
ncbi:MAG: hypothetical protein FWE50_00520 [Alphaproteobacteria bacterium]|nr:hypothetical protein [Alphaproteobacteria bacterium]